jgi:LytR cell envelope-related transcriptional attenuator
MSTAPQARSERGQVLSSVVAVAAVVAVVIGLLVLFGTGGPGGANNASSSGTPPATSAPPSSEPPSTTTPPTTVPVSTPPATVTQPGTTVTAPQPTKTVTRTAEPQATKGPALGPRPSIEIYNNTRERGLAERTAGRAESAGWRVAGVDNWIGKIVTTTVYYPLGMSGHATQLASDLGIGRTKAALSNMKTDRLTVILTTDYAG